MIRHPRRLALICAIALGLAPGTFLRTHYDHDPQNIAISVTPLAQSSGVSGQLQVTGVWQLTASSPFFGGFSALVNSGAIMGENTNEGALLAGSDKGWTLAIPLDAGEPVESGLTFTYFAHRRGSFASMFDLEAMARDPDTGTLWTAYEGFNAVQRDQTDGTSARIAPPEIRRWSANSGPEAMVRLADGRFIILAEAPEGSGHEYDGRATRPGVLFAGDPVEDAAADPVTFRLSTPPKYSPVDATQLPDGSVLILLRRLQITVPATFDAAIMRADPSDIAAGGVWSGEVIAQLEGSLFGENFEGIAYVSSLQETSPQDQNGREGAIYLISDDNLSVFQRSLLVRLDWPSSTTNP